MGATGGEATGGLVTIYIRLGDEKNNCSNEAKNILARRLRLRGGIDSSDCRGRAQNPRNPQQRPGHIILSASLGSCFCSSPSSVSDSYDVPTSRDVPVELLKTQSVLRIKPGYSR